ncbi:MAG: hypothetical protein KKC39_01995 [Candidatus Omnitrophica bacterium]|nr:hypothetical protein [Candidatus Omnitrophota bacterium]MBU4418971.1 hypothetical protein [Candidatus Omnitrophota bacterium]MBU4467505.1 hypothetical protein [Candidatus Omnitrophota bacterium]MCG2713308.1 hypothetical protein [Candidatus Omnitrophota bacterium]
MYKKKGQSILEYVIVLTVIVIAVALAATNLIKPAVNKGLDDAAKTINKATDQLPK